MKEILVTAYPKSGLTWLIHMLCDLLDSPQQDNEDDISRYWGPGREGGYVIRKRHTPYKKTLEGKTVIFTQRDPRDVVVSSMFYRSNSEAGLMANMGPMLASEPVYTRWLGSWIKGRHYTAATRYELLHSNGAGELARLYQAITGEIPPAEKVGQVLSRQSFEKMKAQMDPVAPTFCRKGIVGDWRNHFTRELGRYFNQYMGGFMLGQGYINSLDWWEALPE